MAIRRVVIEDIPLIRKLLAQLPHPPYYPSDDPLIRMIESDRESLFVDDTEDALCYCRANLGGRYVRVLWLLPRAEWGVDNTKALAALLTTCAVDFLAKDWTADDWKFIGEFQGLMDGGKEICEWWRDSFPQVALQVAKYDSEKWEIWCTLRNATKFVVL